MAKNRPKDHKVEAAYIAGLLHGYIIENETFLTEEQIQHLSAAEVILVKETKSEALLNTIK